MIVTVPAPLLWSLNVAQSETKPKGTRHVPTSLVIESLGCIVVLDSVVVQPQMTATNADIELAVLLSVACESSTTTLDTPWHADKSLVVSIPLCGVQDTLLLVAFVPMGKLYTSS